LAKQAYRQALALNSHLWDAKYNLELAMHLFPEMDRLNLPEQEAQTPPPQLWTTIPGFPRGLP
jgi:mxaK protein